MTQADGPDGSSYCGEPVAVREYAAVRGAKIYELELTCIRETYPGSDADPSDDGPEAADRYTGRSYAEGVKGPTYSVDISQPWRKRILVADPVGADPRRGETKGKIEPAVLRRILGTLVAFPIQQPPGVCVEDLRNRDSIGIRPHNSKPPAAR